QWGIKVHLLLLGVGPLLGPYYETADVAIAYDKTIITNLLDKYRAAGIRSAIVNSAASAHVVPWAEQRGIKTTLLVHEMPQLLQEYNLEIQARLGAAAASHLVFAASCVAEKFTAALNLQHASRIILPQGNYQNMAFNAAARERIRRELNIEDEDFLVLGAGFGYIRKGFDLFLQLAQKFSTLRGGVHFIWVGDIQPTLHTYLAPEMNKLIAAGRFHHIPFTQHAAGYFTAADIFALTSREDPYPTVVIEALACGIPCVAFDESGGIPELLHREKAGRVARLADMDDFLAQMTSLLDHEKLRQLRPRLAAMAAQKFDFPAYVEKLLHLAQPGLRSVSAAVINYNYAQHLPARLESIFAQTYPLAEILFLDDASTDTSLTVAQATADAARREIRIIANKKNTGSVFAQWRRAAREAKGEFIWLCEADDSATPMFLSRLMEALTSAETPLLAFTDSRAVDETGKQVMPSYQSYYFDSGVKELAASGIWEAQTFAQRILAVRNLIPNVSAVLWRREALLAALDAVPDIEIWRLAGDWRLYLALLTGQPGSVVYLAEPLNTHRRHAGGVTQRLSPKAHTAEIAAMHKIIVKTLKPGKHTQAEQAAYLARIHAQLNPARPDAAKAKPAKPVARKRNV
ncbi:glycosyltransferase, partial [Acidocella sp.]|uniref:glycosyltransferase n=1 Tax=Acidocella sp. TaxID=50710 RepID=UPI0017C824B1